MAKPSDLLINRRKFLLASASVGISSVVFTRHVHANEVNNPLTQKTTHTPPITLAECQTLSPYAMAAQSTLIQNAKTYLYEQIQSINDKHIRLVLMDIYQNAVPTVVINLSEDKRRSLWSALYAKGYTSHQLEDFLPPIPITRKVDEAFFTAAGSGYQSHHSYPGGLATHVANNTYITNTLLESYRSIYGYQLNRDAAVAAQLFHDLHKPYVFQWNADGSTRIENQLAGTGEHHILSCAELIYRKIPAQYIVATICAHTAPTSDKEKQEIVRWIDAAAMIADTDPVEYGLLEKRDNELCMIGEPSQEAFVCHLADHDYVLSVPAVKNVLPIMQEIAKTDYRLSDQEIHSKAFNHLRNYIFSTHSAMKVYEYYVNHGKNGVRSIMLETVSV